MKRSKFIKTSGMRYILFLMLSLLPVAVLPAENSAKQGDFIRGAKAWAENCSRCHNIRDPKEMTDDAWRVTMFHMRIRGGLTGQDTRDILTFLQRSN